MLSTVTNCLVLPHSGDDDYVQTGFDCVHSSEFVIVVAFIQCTVPIHAVSVLYQVLCI